jgi:hypothetical protein
VHDSKKSKKLLLVRGSDFQLRLPRTPSTNIRAIAMLETALKQNTTLVRKSIKA